MFFPYASYNYKKVKPFVPITPFEYYNIIPVKKTTPVRTGCIICNYIVVSPQCKCLHNYCDYCLTYQIHYTNNKCEICV